MEIFCQKGISEPIGGFCTATLDGLTGVERRYCQSEQEASALGVQWNDEVKVLL